MTSPSGLYNVLGTQHLIDFEHFWKYWDVAIYIIPAPWDSGETRYLDKATGKPLKKDFIAVTIKLKHVASARRLNGSQGCNDR